MVVSVLGFNCVYVYGEETVMRGFSSLASSRASPVLKNISKQPTNLEIANKNNPLKLRLKQSLQHEQTHHNNHLEAPSEGNSSSSKSYRFSHLGSSVSAAKQLRPIDHSYISQILARKDWFLLLGHELRDGRISLVPQFVVSVLQNQEDPLHPLRFYIWVSNVEPSLAKNQSVKGVLANALYRKGPVVLSVELLRDIKSSGFQVSEDLLCVLIGSWGRLGLAKYCADIFGQVSYLGVSLSTRLYNAVIDALVRSNSIDLAYLKFQQMAVDNCKPDRFTYNILIHGVCKAGVVDEALRLVKQMEGLGYLPNVYTYTILIDGFCNVKRVDEAFRVLETMKERNVRPNDATVRSLVHGSFRCLAPQKAFELLVRFMEKEPRMWKLASDSLLCSLSNNSMAREAAMILRKIGQRGHLPKTSTFNITMTCLIKGLDPDEICEILDNFIERGVKPGFTIYLTLIQALYKVGKGMKGDCYLNHMVKDGLVSNVSSYNMLIDCFCKVSMMDRATKTFGEMRRKGVAPNLITFNTLIKGHCKDGGVHKARELFEMLIEYGFKPDIFTFSSIIDGLCQAHQIEDAFNCFTEMVEWGVPPNAITYNILIRSLCVIGDVPRSLRLLRKMQADGISPDMYSFNPLIQSFCRMNKIERAKKLLDSMLTLGLSPDNYSFGAIIKALSESGRLDEAKEMFLSMDAKGCTFDSYVCNLILEALVQHFRFEEARDIWNRCKERGISLKSIPNL